MTSLATSLEATETAPISTALQIIESYSFIVIEITVLIIFLRGLIIKSKAKEL